MTGPSSYRMNDRRGMHRLWIAVGLALACSLLLIAPPRSLAQEFRATLTGQVTDASGAVVAKATVTATNTETGSVYTADTSNAGVYYIPYVLPGTYTVKATAPGFKTAIQDKVLLLAGKYFGQNFTLEVGAIAETVEVKDEPAMIETREWIGGNDSGRENAAERSCEWTPGLHADRNGAGQPVHTNTVRTGWIFWDQRLGQHQPLHHGRRRESDRPGQYGKLGRLQSVHAQRHQHHATDQLWRSGSRNLERLADSGLDSGSQRDDRHLRCPLRTNNRRHRESSDQEWNQRSFTVSW